MNIAELGQYRQDLGKEVDFTRQTPRIVLVTDFGNNLAGAECELMIERTFRKLSGGIPRLTTVHDVRPFNRVDAAFTIERLAAVAPNDTILVGVVDPGVGTSREGIIIKTEEQHTFVGPNNGIFWETVIGESISGVWKINEGRYWRSTTFHGRDIFSPVAAELACGVNPDVIGERMEAERVVKLYFRSDQVLHVDHYGNYKLNSNIPLGATHVLLHASSGIISIPLVTTFQDVKPGELLAYLGSSGLLEIAVREGNAGWLLQVEVGDCLLLDWKVKRLE